MKFFRTALILVIVAIAAGFTYWFFEVKKKGEKKEAEEQSAILFGKKDSKIVKLVLTKKGSDPIVIEWVEEKPPEQEAAVESPGEDETDQEKGEWRIKAPVETGGDNTAIESLVSSIKNSKRESVVYEDLQKQDEYGLDDPEFSLRFSYEDDPREYGISFGIESLDRKRVFAKLVGQNIIIAMTADEQRSLDKSLFDLRNKTLAPVKNEDIAGVSILHGREFIVLKKEDDTWYLLPDRIKASESRVEMYTGTLRWGSFVEVMEENTRDFSRYGLDRPRLLVTFKMKDDSTFMFIVGNPVQEGEAQFFYATRSTDQLIFQVQADTVQKLVTSEFYLKDRSIFDFKQETVNAVRLNYDDKNLYFEKRGDEWLYIPKDEAETEALKKLYGRAAKKGEEAGPGMALERGYKIDNIIRSIVTAEYEEKEPVKRGQSDYMQTGITDPKYRVTMSFGDGKEPLEVLLTAKDGQSGKLYLSPDNGRTVYYTSGYFTANFPEKLEELFE